MTFEEWWKDFTKDKTLYSFPEAAAKAAWEAAQAQDQPEPSWEDAPEWANHLAQDIDGLWCWYEEAPEIDCSGGYWTNQNPGRLQSVKGCKGPYWWERSLRKRP